MTKQSVITLPDGTTIAISPDLSPEQITAMITALTMGKQMNASPSKTKVETGKTYIEERTVEDIWRSSKKEKVALFIRNNFSQNLWFGSKDIVEQQLTVTGKLALGESSAIGTYLTRLFEAGYLDRKKGNGRTILYRMTDRLMEDYPAVEIGQFSLLIENSL